MKRRDFMRLAAGAAASPVLWRSYSALAQTTKNVDSSEVSPSDSGAAKTSATEVPLIARAKFFGNPTRAQGRLSPDGKWLSWLAPRNGVLNIWLAPASNPSEARALTAEMTRPIRDHSWAPDSSMVLFTKDKGGDENFLLYGVDIGTGAERPYTPFENTRVRIAAVSARVKDRILVGLNNRDPRWHDVYSLDLASGALALVLTNEGYGDFWADQNLTLRIVSKPRDDGGVAFFRVNDGTVESESFASAGFDDEMTTSPLWFTADGRTLYWQDSRGRDTAALIAQDVASGNLTVLAENSKADISGFLSDPETNVVQAYATNYLRNEWTALDRAIRADLAYLEAELKGDLSVTSQTDANDAWIVEVDAAAAPVATYRYDRTTKALAKLFVSRRELEGETLAAMIPIEIRSRDGLTLVSYLTLPPASDPNGNGRPDKPVPMVLLVHGGPWSRDVYGYYGLHQWLANRGYAVLSVNFRGSTGFGKAFVSAGDLEWGAKMHDDLIDAVGWAVAAGITTPDKVAIMGQSYGGYATLVGLTFTPDRFACGVDIVGPSNLNALLGSSPAYWTADERSVQKRVGDPTTQEGRQLLHDRSPLFKAEAIKKPLLIGQGANDPRVKQSESDQIVNAMAKKGIPVTYVLFPDEGHGFARPENRIAFFAAAEQFLAAFLGGRAEPIDGAIKVSSATVPHGAAFTPGLVEALAP
jgi:dipeptidyl aminopeptidase/acylaminoacyl peptidase